MSLYRLIIANPFLNPHELEAALGARIRELRLRANLGQAEVAASAGVGRKAIYSLEKGSGSTVETLLRVLKALGLTDPIAALAPAPQVSPLAVLRSPKPRQRAGRKSKGNF
jgi:transcriptional regulator with XRE-family HTH domain